MLGGSTNVACNASCGPASRERWCLESLGPGGRHGITDLDAHLYFVTYVKVVNDASVVGCREFIGTVTPFEHAGQRGGIGGRLGAGAICGRGTELDNGEREQCRDHHAEAKKNGDGAMFVDR